MTLEELWEKLDGFMSDGVGLDTPIVLQDQGFTANLEKVILENDEGSISIVLRIDR